MPATSESVTIRIDGSRQVSGLLLAPPAARVCYVFAHGAGAGMRHAFMAAIADALAARDIATLRYQFPYMESGSKRPDTPKVAQAAVRAAVAHAASLLPGIGLIAGGKSFGGRMTSQAQAHEPLPGVTGLAFFGFPLHPAGQPSSDRANHLAGVHVPMLFLQGTRDELAQLALVRQLQQQLGTIATLREFDDADHSFHVRKRSGRDDAGVVVELADAFAQWSKALGTRPG